MPPPAPATGGTVAARQRGELRLGFERTASGGTILRERYRSGLFHVGKPYDEQGRLVLQVLNPTAGLFEHDRMHAEVKVGPGATACLLAPSSSQVYQMTGDGFAESTLRIEVADGASLVHLPRWSVLHHGARLHQRSEIRLSAGASLVHLEQISAGRLAHGEFLEFAALRSDLEIFREGRLILKERWHGGTDLRRWIWAHRGEPCAYLATLYICSPQPIAAVETTLEGLRDEESAGGSFGLTRLATGFHMLRILAPSNRSVSRLLLALQAFLPASLRFPEVFSRIS